MHLCAVPDAGSASNLPRDGAEDLQEARDPAFGPLTSLAGVCGILVASFGGLSLTLSQTVRREVATTAGTGSSRSRNTKLN